MYDTIKNSLMRFNTLYIINYGVFCKEKDVQLYLIYANNALILATICLLVSERAGLLEQKIDP